MPADLNFNESVAWGMQFTRTWNFAKFNGMNAGLHREPPTPTGATSGHEGWIPLGAPPPWMPMRTYNQGGRFEPNGKMPCAWEPKLRPGLFEHKGVSKAFLYCAKSSLGKAR